MLDRRFTNKKQVLYLLGLFNRSVDCDLAHFRCCLALRLGLLSTMLLAMLLHLLPTVLLLGIILGESAGDPHVQAVEKGMAPR